MLLDAGGSLPSIVAEADADTLAAISEWGPTWQQAQILKAGPTNRDAMTQVVDPAALGKSVRLRWAEVLDGYAPQIIRAGIEAETAEARFDATANNMQVNLHGSHELARDALASIVAGLSATPPVLREAETD